MMITTTPLEHQSDVLWTARLDHIRILLTLLKAIHSSRWMICRITSHGLKCSSYGDHDSTAAIAHAYLQDKLCQDYRFKGNEDEEHVFKLDLNAFTECLHMWMGMHLDKSPTGLLPIRLTYTGSEVTAMLEESGIGTVVRFKAFIVDRPLPLLDFRSHEITSRLILKSEVLKDALQELNPQSEAISIYISPQYPYFRISSESPLGTIEIDVPRQSELMENFQCDYPQTFKYKYALMVPAMKAITSSSKTSLRLNDQGYLSLQFMILTEEDQASFVEYTANAKRNLCRMRLESDDFSIGRDEYFVADMNLQPGVIVYIHEILDSPLEFHRKSVRVMGRLKTYDVYRNRALIEYRHVELNIDTSLLDVFEHKMNGLFQFIGELEKDDEHGVLLKARVIRCVEGLDLNLWEQALELRRNFEKEREEIGL